MSKIVTLEDNVSAPAMPVMPSMQSWGSDNAQVKVVPAVQKRPSVIYAPVSAPCTCGRCSRCHKQSQWGAPTPTVNITVSPTITANGGAGGSSVSTSRATNAGSVSSPVDEVPVAGEGYVRERAPETRIIERQLPPEIVERTQYIPVPVKQVVERIKREPLFMPFKTVSPVDRPVPIPVEVITPVDRPVPIPVEVITPVDRSVPIPVKVVTPVDRTVPIPVRNDTRGLVPPTTGSGLQDQEEYVTMTVPNDTVIMTRDLLIGFAIAGIALTAAYFVGTSDK